MDTRLRPKPKGAGKLVAVRVGDPMHNYLENEANLHGSTVSEVIRAIVRMWYDEQVPDSADLRKVAE